MAKKNLTNSGDKEVTSATAATTPATATVRMEDNNDNAHKFDSLKLLNTRLLREMDSSRRTVESLRQSKESLEAELTRTNSENEVLRTELARVGDGAVQSEIERDVVDVFVGLQATENELKREKEAFEVKLKDLEEELMKVMREKSEIEEVRYEKEGEIVLLNDKLNALEAEIDEQKRVSDEVIRDRDEMKSKLDFQIAETGRLTGLLEDAARRSTVIQDEVEKLRAEYKVALEKLEEKEREIQSITEDKKQMETRLAVSENVIEELKNKIKESDREKERINDEKNLEVSELENRVTLLNVVMGNFKNEEEKLRRCVVDLENRVIEGTEEAKDMRRMIDESVKEKNEIQMRLQELIEEKVSLEKNLNQTLKQLDEEKRTMEQILNEKNHLADEKLRKENEIVELEKQVSELKDAILSIDESSNDQKEQIKNLTFELEHYRDDLVQVTRERDAARKELNEEKQNGVTLKQKITEMENKIEETLELVEKIKSENKNISKEKENLENHCNKLKKEIISLENDLFEARKLLDVMQEKVEAAHSSSGLLLQALKATAEFVHSNLEKVASLEESNYNLEMMDSYVAEQLEEIKNAFKIKENKVEEMKRQVEFLQNSLAVAHKKKSFWTIVSYATTLFAAISLALSKFYFQASSP